MIVAYLGGLNTRVATVSLKILSKKKKIAYIMLLKMLNFLKLYVVELQCCVNFICTAK